MRASHGHAASPSAMPTTRSGLLRSTAMSYWTRAGGRSTKMSTGFSSAHPYGSVLHGLKLSAATASSDSRAARDPPRPYPPCGGVRGCQFRQLIDHRARLIALSPKSSGQETTGLPDERAGECWRCLGPPRRRRRRWRAGRQYPGSVYSSAPIFEYSAPVQTLVTAGLTDLPTRLPDADRYTYVFEGNSQVLDPHPAARLTRPGALQLRRGARQRRVRRPDQ